MTLPRAPFAFQLTLVQCSRVGCYGIELGEGDQGEKLSCRENHDFKDQESWYLNFSVGENFHVQSLLRYLLLNGNGGV